MDERYAAGSQTIARKTTRDVSREGFLVRTYNHLFGSILLFILIEWFLFNSGIAQTLAESMLGVNWLFVLGGFILVSWMARKVAYSATSVASQYLALAGFVLAEAIIFVPMLFMASHYAPGAIQSAGTITLLGFGALTGIAFWTKKDFSFLGGLLRWGGILALLAIVGGVMFGLSLGTWFSVAMVGLAGAAILYDTQRIIYDFPEDCHVGAALELFASVALMFWYVLRIVSSRD